MKNELTWKDVERWLDDYAEPYGDSYAGQIIRRVAWSAAKKAKNTETLK